MTRRAHILSATLLSGAALALSACGTTTRDFPAPLDVRNGVTVAESVERLELYPNQNGLELSARDRHAMVGFLSGYARQGNGPIYLNSPSQGGSGIAVAEREVRNALSGLGLHGVAVQQGSYAAPQGAPAPLVVSYRRLKTLVPRCSSGHEELSETFYNTPSANWGCAYYANIAAMVGDPNQFVSPYAFDPPAMPRRMEQYRKYLAGEPTGATKPPGQNVSSQDTGGGG